MTLKKLAAAGHALYGGRWQTPLAHDLGVADRTVRRWLSGKTPIPADVENRLRGVLVTRLKEIGGMIGYSVNPSNRSVFHYPTGAFFHYDEAGKLMLRNPEMLPKDKIPLIAEAAEEALRQERERDPKIKLTWLGNNGRTVSTQGP